MKPERVLTDEEIRAEVRFGPIVSESDWRELVNFARRIEAMVVERISSQLEEERDEARAMYEEVIETREPINPPPWRSR